MSVVYFVRATSGEGPVKIGVTTNLAHRLKMGRGWSAVPIEVIATIPGDKYTEHRFHALFEADHLHLEWFAWSDRMASVIETIQSGHFVIDCLPPAKFVGLRKAMADWSLARAEQAAA